MTSAPLLVLLVAAVLVVLLAFFVPGSLWTGTLIILLIALPIAYRLRRRPARRGTPE